MSILSTWERVGLIATACLISGLSLYYAGDSHGHASERAAQVEERRRSFDSVSKVAEQRMAQRAPIIQQASARVDTVRVRYTESKAHVIVVSDTTLRIDSLIVPTMPPIAERIRSSDSLVVALDSLNKLQAAHLVDLALDRNTWRSRALLDEANMPKASRWRTVLHWVELGAVAYGGYRIGRGS